MATIDNVRICRSAKGVPHTLYDYRGLTFSVVYFGKSNMYRIFQHGQDNSKLLDIPLGTGGRFQATSVFDKLITEHKLPANPTE